MFKEAIAPAEEPVTLAEAKLFARETGTAQDAVITGLIVSARLDAEHITGRLFITQTWDLFLDEFADEIQLKQPLQSVASVTYVDANGATQTLANTVYEVDTAAGKLRLAYNQTWPTTRSKANAVTIRFVSGYGAAAAVPEGIKKWIKTHVAYSYEYRENADLQRLAGGLFTFLTYE